MTELKLEKQLALYPDSKVMLSRPKAAVLYQLRLAPVLLLQAS